MIVDRLLGGDDGDDSNHDEAMAYVDERYEDLVGRLHSSPDNAMFLVLEESSGLHFYYNFDNPEKMADFLGLFAVAVHEIFLERHGDDAADALLARVLAECVSGGE